MASQHYGSVQQVGLLVLFCATAATVVTGEMEPPPPVKCARCLGAKSSKADVQKGVNDLLGKAFLGEVKEGDYQIMPLVPVSADCVDNPTGTSSFACDTACIDVHAVMNFEHYGGPSLGNGPDSPSTDTIKQFGTVSISYRDCLNTWVETFDQERRNLSNSMDNHETSEALYSLSDLFRRKLPKEAGKCTDMQASLLGVSADVSACLCRSDGCNANASPKRSVTAAPMATLTEPVAGTPVCPRLAGAAATCTTASCAKACNQTAGYYCCPDRMENGNCVGECMRKYVPRDFHASHSYDLQFKNPQRQLRWMGIKALGWTRVHFMQPAIYYIPPELMKDRMPPEAATDPGDVQCSTMAIQLLLDMDTTPLRDFYIASMSRNAKYVLHPLGIERFDIHRIGRSQLQMKACLDRVIPEITRSGEFLAEVPTFASMNDAKLEIDSQILLPFSMFVGVCNADGCNRDTPASAKFQAQDWSDSIVPERQCFECFHVSTANWPLAAEDRQDVEWGLKLLHSAALYDPQCETVPRVKAQCLPNDVCMHAEADINFNNYAGPSIPPGDKDATMTPAKIRGLGHQKLIYRGCAIDGLARALTQGGLRNATVLAEQISYTGSIGDLVSRATSEGSCASGSVEDMMGLAANAKACACFTADCNSRMSLGVKTPDAAPVPPPAAADFTKKCSATPVRRLEDIVRMATVSPDYAKQENCDKIDTLPDCTATCTEQQACCLRIDENDYTSAVRSYKCTNQCSKPFYARTGMEAYQCLWMAARSSAGTGEQMAAKLAEGARGQGNAMTATSDCVASPPASTKSTCQTLAIVGSAYLDTTTYNGPSLSSVLAKAADATGVPMPADLADLGKVNATVRLCMDGMHSEYGTKILDSSFPRLGKFMGCASVHVPELYGMVGMAQACVCNNATECNGAVITSVVPMTNEEMQQGGGGQQETATQTAIDGQQNQQNPQPAGNSNQGEQQNAATTTAAPDSSGQEAGGDGTAVMAMPIIILLLFTSAALMLGK